MCGKDSESINHYNGKRSRSGGPGGQSHHLGSRMLSPLEEWTVTPIHRGRNFMFSAGIKSFWKRTRFHEEESIPLKESTPTGILLEI